MTAQYPTTKPQVYSNYRIVDGTSIFQDNQCSPPLEELDAVIDKIGVTDSTDVNSIEWKVNNIGLKYSGTQIYDATLPTSWTDLNIATLASITAARYKVSLKVRIPTTGTPIAFRMNGDTEDVGYSAGSTAWGAGISAAQISEGEIVYISVLTDTSGIIEVRATAAVHGDIWLYDYQRIL